MGLETVKELIDEVLIAKELIEAGKNEGFEKLRFLFAPIGLLQDTSYDSGWGDKYLELAYRLAL